LPRSHLSQEAVQTGKVHVKIVPMLLDDAVGAGDTNLDTLFEIGLEAFALVEELELAQPAS
jgi:hypothetical protein